MATGVMTVLAAVETVSLVDSQPSSGDPALPVLVLILGVFAAYVIGLILFSVAIIRAGVLPRSAGVVLLAAVLLKMFASDASPGTLALLGLAVTWVGVAAWRAAAR